MNQANTCFQRDFNHQTSFTGIFFTSGDIILALVIIICGLVVTLKPVSTLNIGRVCHIKGPDFDKKIELKKLDKPMKIVVHGKKGETLVAITNKEVFIESSCCANKNCIHMGSIKRPGEFLLCAPNNVAVIIEKTSQEKEELHGITY